MRSFRDAKLMAKSLRETMAARQVPLTHSETLEIVARQFGYDDWNVLAARIGEAEPGMEADKPAEAVRLQMGIPVLRIFDEAKAKEFYLGFLGFTMDWDHRFGPTCRSTCRSRAPGCSSIFPSITAMPAPARPSSSGWKESTPIAPS